MISAELFLFDNYSRRRVNTLNGKIGKKETTFSCSKLNLKIQVQKFSRSEGPLIRFDKLKSHGLRLKKGKFECLKSIKHRVNNQTLESL